MHAGASRTKLAAFVLLGLGIAFYVMFSVGEMAGGDVSGIQHVPPAVILAVLFWVAWKHPLKAGIVLLVLAVPLAIAYVVVLVVNDLPLTWALVIALPPVLTGFLLVRAGRQERSSP